jgi:hypothetical protein
MVDDLRQSQDAAVTVIAKSISESWERVVVNYEMAESEDGTEHDMLGFYIVSDQAGRHAKKPLDLTPEIQEAFSDLNAASLSTNKQNWGTCDLTLDSNGKYTFDFSFDPPKRINGILDEASYYRFGKYLDEYSRLQK